MRVILLEDVKKQGKKDDIITVKDGYGMYLINNKKAVLETKKSSDVLRHQTETRALEENLYIKECEDVRDKLEKLVLKFKVKVGAGGQVFGKISSKQIAARLSELGFSIDKKKIIIDVPINSLGITNVKIILYKKVSAILKVELHE